MEDQRRWRKWGGGRRGGSCGRCRTKQQRRAGNTGADIRLVNIDFINTSLLLRRYTHTRTFFQPLTLPPSLSGWDKYFSGVLFWDGGYFAHRRHYNGFPNPFSSINYSDVTEPHYVWKCSQLTESSGSRVSVSLCVCVCVNIPSINTVR